MRLLVALLLVPILTIYKGWVVATLWGWFLVPYGAVPISIPLAIGISCLVVCLTARPYLGDEDIADITIYSYALGVPLLCLIFGYVAKQFLPI